MCASSVKKRGIARAKQAHWRRKVHEASISSKSIWKLAKWACTKNFLHIELLQMPDIKWQDTVYSTVEGKAEALCKRFYLSVEADTEDIVDLELCQQAEGEEPVQVQELGIEQQVTTDEI